MKKIVLKFIFIIECVLSFFTVLYLVVPFDKLKIVFPSYIINNNLIVESFYIILGSLYVLQLILLIISALITKFNVPYGLYKVVHYTTLVLLIYLVYVGFLSSNIVSLIFLLELLIESLKGLTTNKILICRNATLYMAISLTLFYNLPFELYGYMVSNFLIFLSIVLTVIYLLNNFIFERK